MQTILPSGDILAQDRESAVIRFAGRRKVLSTSALCGGLRTDLTAVYNHNDCPRAGKYCEMAGDTMEEHQAHAARALGLDPLRTAGLHTGANMDNAALHTVGCGDFSVTAIATGGVEVNACRAGTPALLDERDGRVMPPGTINIILLIDADLSDGCMARALVTSTEAKAAAMQELVVSDRYGRGLATGSGTDGVIIVSNSQSPTRLREAGPPFLLGEHIGRAVIEAVKEALYRQSGLCAGMQHSVLRRLERFGVTEEAAWRRYGELSGNPVSRADFAGMMSRMTADGAAVVIASLYAHLIDQAIWGLILPQEAVETGDRLLKLTGLHHGVHDSPRAVFSANSEELADNMAAAYVEMIARWIVDSE